MAALTNLSLFWDTFSGIQDGFGPIGAWCRCFNWCFFCFWGFGPLSFWILWTLCEIFEAIFAFSYQSRGQFYWIDNHVPNSPMPPNIYVGILPVYTFIIDNIAVQKLVFELRWRGWLLSERPSKKHISRVCKWWL